VNAELSQFVVKGFYSSQCY